MINTYTELLKPIAAKFNLSLTSFGEAITDPAIPYYGSVALSDPWNSMWEPAPISPYKRSAAFDILSGTIKSVYNAHRGLRGDDDIKVYPAYIAGNTGEEHLSFGYQWTQIPPIDTRFYWKLSENIYRYNHGNMLGNKRLGNIHTVNERRLTSLIANHQLTRGNFRYISGQLVGEDRILHHPHYQC